MLGENVNKMVFVIWAGAIVAGLFGVSMVLFPSAMNQVGDTIKHTTTNFMSPKADEVSLSVNIPDQENRGGFVYDNIGYNHDLPLFEINTDDNNHYTDDDALVSKWFEPSRKLIDKYEPGTIYGDFPEAVVQSKSRYDYRNGLDDWLKSNKNQVSPFRATDSNGDDITGKIKFDSIKVTKIETADGTTSVDDNADNNSGYWNDDKVKFNTEYSNYHDLFKALYYYDQSRHRNGRYVLDSKGNKVPWASWSGIPEGSDVPVYTYDEDVNNSEDNTYYRVYPYISKSYLTATYSVTGKDGKTVTKSSSFIMKSLDSYKTTQVES